MSPRTGQGTLPTNDLVGSAKQVDYAFDYHVWLDTIVILPYHHCNPKKYFYLTTALALLDYTEETTSDTRKTLARLKHAARFNIFTGTLIKHGKQHTRRQFLRCVRFTGFRFRGIRRRRYHRRRLD